jgi:hypothetical protein
MDFHFSSSEINAVTTSTRNSVAGEIRLKFSTEFYLNAVLQQSLHVESEISLF